MGVVIVICLPLPQRKPLRSTASERLLYFDPQGLGHFCLSGDLQTGRVCGYGLSFPFYEMGLEGSSGMAWGGSGGLVDRSPARHLSVAQSGPQCG